MITPIIKDRVLKVLCTLQSEQSHSINVSPFCDEANVSFDQLNAILYQFERCGFISHLNLRQSVISLVVRLEAQDFMQRGGFYAQEELIANNIKKLLLEIDNLKSNLEPKHLDIIEKLGNIGNAVMTGYNMMIGQLS